MISFDPSITVGALLNMLAMLIGGTIFAVTVRGEVRALVQRVGRLETVTDALDKTLQRVAVQDERLNSHARRLEGLENQLLDIRHSRDD